MCGDLITIEVGGGIDEHLVDGVGVNVLWSDVSQIDLIDLCAVVYLIGRPWGRYDIAQVQSRFVSVG
jgi:hypothetical protein